MTAMNPTVNRATQNNSLKKIAIVVAGALAGAVAGSGIIRVIKTFGVSVHALTLFDLGSMTIALLFMAIGVVQTVLALNRAKLGKMLDGEGLGPVDDIGERLPATDREIGAVRMQSAVLILAGILLLLPIAAQGPIENHPGVAGWIFAGIAVMFAAQTVLNVRVWQTCDEFVRTGILKTCAATFFLCQSALFLWAAAERLHLVSGVTNWSIYTLLMTCYLAVSATVSMRSRQSL